MPRRAIQIIAVISSVITLLAADVSAQDAAEKATGFDFPADRAGEIAGAFITAFNSGDKEAISAFIMKYGSQRWQDERDKEMWSYDRMYQLLGTLTPHGIPEKDENTIVILVKSESIDSYFTVGLELDDGTPMLLLEHYIRPAARPK